MATALPLPKPDSLPESVLFHRELPAGTRIIMQLPNDDRSEAETWVLQIGKFEHDAWFRCLPNNRALLDMLQVEEHVGYCPRTGYIEAIPDLDTPTPTSMLLAFARFQAERTFSPSIEEHFAKRAIRGRSTPVSTLRLALGGGGGLRAR